MKRQASVAGIEPGPSDWESSAPRTKPLPRTDVCHPILSYMLPVFADSSVNIPLIQICQPSRFRRESHDFGPYLTLSRQHHNFSRSQSASDTCIIAHARTDSLVVTSLHSCLLYVPLCCCILYIDQVAHTHIMRGSEVHVILQTLYVCSSCVLQRPFVTWRHFTPS